MSIHDVAQQNENNVPNAKLVAYFEKYFPIYVVELNVSVIKDQELSVLAEFILKLIKVQITDAYSMQLFLGVSIETVRHEISQLAIFGLITSLDQEHYKLTAKAIGALEDMRLAPVREERFTIKMDALTGEFYQHYACPTVIIIEQVDMVIRPLLSFPKLWDITSRYQDIKNLYMQYQGALIDASQITKFDDVIEISNCYTQYKKMNILVFQTIDGDISLQVFDGIQYMPQYEIPINKLIEKGLALWQEPDVELREEPQLLEEEWMSLATEKVEYKTPPVSFLTTTEHFSKLQEAFLRAKSEIYIISPWVASIVINDLYEDMQSFIQRGGRLTIGYGYPRDTSTKMEQTERTIRKLEKRLHSANFSAVHLGDTHEKILLCDDLFAVIGSYNWLSFRGSRNMGFVAETSVCLQEKQAVKELKVRVLQRLDKHSLEG